MIKICIVSTTSTTITAFFGEQLNFLQQQGFDVTVVTATNATTQNFGNSIPENIKLLSIPMSRKISPLEDIKALTAMTKIMKSEQFDIVQYVTPKGALLGALSSLIAKVPVRLYLMWGLYYVTQKGIKKTIFKAVERLVCSCSTTIAPDSQENCEVAVAEGLCGKDKIGIVGCGSANGVDVKYFDPEKYKNHKLEIRSKHQIPEDAFVFGTIAAITGDKGVNELIESFVEVEQKTENTFLLFIGDVTEKDPVSDKTLLTIKEHPGIIHVGWQKNPPEYLAAMDVFVLPTYREGFGVVNVEASAMKLPVISTNVPGPREAIEDDVTGILVPARQTRPLINAMIRLKGDPELRKRMGESGRQRVLEKFEQKKLWKAIVEHRRNLLKAVGPAAEA
jgi:glycosyltransferase involved in cell wall biosynthesis